MPELPEVETIARGLHKRVAGDTIESVWLGEKPEPLKSSPEEIAGFWSTRESCKCVEWASISCLTSNEPAVEEGVPRDTGNGSFIWE